MLDIDIDIEVTQWCSALCDPMDCSLPGSSIHGIFQARILKWVAISYFTGSDSGIELPSLASSASAGVFYTTWQPGKPSLRLREHNYIRIKCCL